MFCKKGVLKNFANFTGKNLCQNLILIKFHAFRERERDRERERERDSNGKVNSCKILEIFKNTYFEEHQLTYASKCTYI